MEKRKDRKIWKSRSEEKLMTFSSVSLLPTRKREAVSQGGTPGDSTFDSKAGRTSETKGSFQIHSRKIRITQA